MNPIEIADLFLTQYYTTLMTNRANLINFYTEVSCMSYGGDNFKGIEQIKQKIQSFGFQTIVYKIDDKDIQPGPIQGSIIVFVTGTLNMDNENTFKFSQVFNICPNNNGYYCHNDIFRLVI